MPVPSLDAVDGLESVDGCEREDTDDNDFITNNFHLWPSEVFQCNNRC